ncbi:MAG: hypothetical protein ACI4RA_10920 [Kiritimatiellia bacterium]
MADIIELAQAVADAISVPGEAEVSFAPEFDLKGLREMKVVVVPSGLEMKPISRSASEDTMHIQVGVLKKCTEDEIVDLVNTVITIGRSFLDRKVAGATCVDVKYLPLYAPEHLRERRQFTGVVELVFKSVFSP